jgi:hypothetical protein
MAPPTTTPSRRQAAAPPSPLGPRLFGPDFEQRLEDRLVELLNEYNPIRQLIPFHFDPTDTTGPGQASPAPWPSRPTWRFGAPASLPAVWRAKADGSLPAPPASAAMQFVTAEAVEIITSHTFSYETADDLRLLFEPSITTPPTAAARAGGAALSALALSLAREEARIITAGAGTVDDPVVGLGSLGGVPEITSSTNVVDSIIEAIASLRGDGREPVGVLIGGSTEKKLRQLKDSAGNFVFAPTAPLKIGSVPIATCFGIPAGTSTFAIVLSAGAAIPFIRPINGRPLEVRVSTQAALQTDQIVVRCRERLGLVGLPGVGLAGLRRIVDIDAP